VADTFENARHAASLLKISYAAEKPRSRKEDSIKADKPKELFGEASSRNFEGVALSCLRFW
jgi:CO/xanthine dehydrogenase Mo-binding subunit